MTLRTIVGISGNFSRPSRTRMVVEAVAAEAVSRGGWKAECFDLVDAGPGLGTTFYRAEAPSDLDRVLKAIETCDALVVGSPVYKASYTGLLKHLFDLLDMNALKGRPVILTATGKAPQHALMIDHQFRPLFAFFGALSLSNTIFATDTDFADASRPGEGMLKRAAAAVDELLRITAN